MENWYKVYTSDLKCFACGKENSCGLKMEFESNGRIMRSETLIAKHHRGWATLAHGGILATILDETMSWAAIHFFKKFILTQSMEIEFLKPVYIEKKVLSNGWIHEKLSERKAFMKSEIINQDNEVCARATGKFALFEPEKFKELDIVPGDLLTEMEGMF
ncbi:MAG: PaaI family thioesterase [Desulforegulaceae bacterium]|jgi:acyl-coenzyme A thioesterase PaaI-like protein|nr:PaaI family thioesterase [Desulforegulaceae bacterium]